MADVEVQRDHDLWACGFEDKLIDMLYQETFEDKLVGSKITNRDCVRLAERLNNLRIKRVDLSQVKGKIARLKKIQHQFTDLMGQTGMGWNPITKTVIGSDEHWANAIRVRSEWTKFKNNGCGNYNVLCMIFGQAVATGVLHFASTQEPPSREEEQHLKDELRARGPMFGTGTRLDSTMDLDAIEITPETQGGAPQQMTPRRRRRDAAGPSISPDLADALKTITASSKARAELDAKMFDLCSSKCSRGESSNTGSDTGYNSVTQCMQFLYDITPSPTFGRPACRNKSFFGS
ncbi:uncharacterized protein LOC122296115 [Carya illinoinensis]|uniref:Myb/SANT-like domain-containing protein n=1 Tax=Carya illinoinensis TaxID=32201 RepID=A0A8T1NAW0_CARIL|nr:uncharacterized protein LOC122296115 [Carya illinoinensis]KAG6626127.1 hypothetical protein CIPAW_15G025900 [Carya illinoinensis]